MSVLRPGRDIARGVAAAAWARRNTPRDAQAGERLLVGPLEAGGREPEQRGEVPRRSRRSVLRSWRGSRMYLSSGCRGRRSRSARRPSPCRRRELGSEVEDLELAVGLVAEARREQARMASPASCPHSASIQIAFAAW